jgi:cell division protein FtsI/penicillin-binding protein 2
MIRIQTSEQAMLFLTQGDLYAGEFHMFYPQRGEIYDRQGHLLAGNRTVYEVGVSLNEMNDLDAMSYVLGTYLDMTFEEVHDKLVNSPETWTYIVIKDYVDAETVASLRQILQGNGVDSGP